MPKGKRKSTNRKSLTSPKRKKTKSNDDDYTIERIEGNKK